MVHRTLSKQKTTRTEVCKTFPGQPKIPPDYIGAHSEALFEVLWEVVGSQTSQLVACKHVLHTPFSHLAKTIDFHGACGVMVVFFAMRMVNFVVRGKSVILRLTWKCFT